VVAAGAPLERGHHVAHLIDGDDHVERRVAGVARMVHADQLELAGPAGDREHRRAGVAGRQLRVHHEVDVVPVLLVVVVVGGDHLADVGGLERAEGEAAHVDDVALLEVRGATHLPGEDGKERVGLEHRHVHRLVGDHALQRVSSRSYESRSDSTILSESDTRLHPGGTSSTLCSSSVTGGHSATWWLVRMNVSPFCCR
jgi:hypothetical protein